MNLSQIVYKAHNTAVEQGFWEGSRTYAECLALVHSEVSEVLEVLRSKDPKPLFFEVLPDGSNKPEGYLVELADVVIRVADMVGKMGLAKEWEDAIALKMSYNERRPRKHGKRF